MQALVWSTDSELIWDLRVVSLVLEVAIWVSRLFMAVTEAVTRVVVAVLSSYQMLADSPKEVELI